MPTLQLRTPEQLRDKREELRTRGILLLDRIAVEGAVKGPLLDMVEEYIHATLEFMASSAQLEVAGNAVRPPLP